MCQENASGGFSHFLPTRKTTFFSLCVHMCMHIHTHIYTQGHAYVSTMSWEYKHTWECACMCMHEQKLDVHFRYLHHLLLSALVLKQGISTEPEAWFRDWPVSSGICLSPPMPSPRTWLTGTHCHTWIYAGFRILNSSPNVYITSMQLGYFSRSKLFKKKHF